MNTPLSNSDFLGDCLSQTHNIGEIAGAVGGAEAAAPFVDLTIVETGLGAWPAAAITALTGAAVYDYAHDKAEHKAEVAAKEACFGLDTLGHAVGSLVNSLDHLMEHKPPADSVTDSSEQGHSQGPTLNDSVCYAGPPAEDCGVDKGFNVNSIFGGQHDNWTPPSDTSFCPTSDTGTTHDSTGSHSSGGGSGSDGSI